MQTLTLHAHCLLVGHMLTGGIVSEKLGAYVTGRRAGLGSGPVRGFGFFRNARLKKTLKGPLQVPSVGDVECPDSQK